jgi:hypothetical protein
VRARPAIRADSSARDDPGEDLLLRIAARLGSSRLWRTTPVWSTVPLVATAIRVAAVSPTSLALEVDLRLRSCCEHAGSAAVSDEVGEASDSFTIDLEEVHHVHARRVDKRDFDLGGDPVPGDQAWSQELR